MLNWYSNDLSKHAFLLLPKSPRNFDPCVIKTKRTPVPLSISGLEAPLLVVCAYVPICSQALAPICFGSTCTV